MNLLLLHTQDTACPAVCVPSPDVFQFAIIAETGLMHSLALDSVLSRIVRDREQGGCEARVPHAREFQMQLYNADDAPRS